MKGLETIPSNSMLLSAYKILQDKVKIVKINLVALYSQWIRFDPRLGEILVQYISLNWKKINPLDLNKEVLVQPWPASMGVVLETAELIIDSQEVGKYRLWKELCMSDIKPADYELYFYLNYKIAGKRMMRDAKYPLDVYKKWGYLAHDLLLNKAASVERTLISKERRMEMLKSILRQREQITVSDYIQELKGAVSRRQAERDLLSLPNVKAKGFTKGRVYTLK